MIAGLADHRPRLGPPNLDTRRVLVHRQRVQRNVFPDFPSEGAADGIPKTAGLFGGSPGNRGETRIVHGSDVNESLAGGDPPTNITDIEGQEVLPEGKGGGVGLGEDSVVDWWWGTPGGYGDPLTREPAEVAEDVRTGAVSEETAVDLYGVVLAADGSVDTEETETRRAELRDQRLAAAEPVREQ